MQRIIILVLFFFVFFVNISYANDVIDSQINELDFDKVQEQIDKTGESLDFKNEVKKVALGETKFDFKTILQAIIDLFVKEIKDNFVLIGQVILLIILSAIIKNLTESFQNKDSGEIAFYICYIVVIMTMLKTYKITFDVAYNTIDNIINLMKFVIPAFISSLVTSGNITTATMADGLVFTGINYAAILIKNILLPITAYLCIIQLINFISEKEILNELNDMIKKAVSFCLKTALAIFLGLSTIQRFTAPVIDGIAKKGVSLTTKTVVPVLGDVMNSAVDTFVNCVILIKNSIGIVAVIAIIFIAAIPVIKILSMIAIYKLAGAIMQPIAEKRIVKCLSQFSENCSLIFMCLITVVLIFVISVAMLVSV